MQGYGLRAFNIEDSSISAAALYAKGCDVVVCSYEFLANNDRGKFNFPERLRAYANDQTGELPSPKRPTAAIASGMWDLLGIPWKRVVLDEVHKVNKERLSRHKALTRIKASAFIMMSGTLPHNVWHNFSGYLALLKNHPFDTHSKFLHTFSSWDADGQTHTPDAAGIALLQKFLQAVLIARPKSILKLKNCDQRSFVFPLLESTATFVSKLTADYKDASVKAALQYKTITGDENSNIHHLTLAVKAQLASLHPMLCEELDKGNIGVEDDENGAQDAGHRAKVKEHDKDESRAAYRERVKARKGLCEESSRLTWFLRLYRLIRETRPDKQIVIFSRFLSWLDIIDEALLRVEKIEALRFDGSLSQKKRQQVERAFLNGDADIPLLISSGAGKPLPSECRKLQSAITNGPRR